MAMLITNVLGSFVIDGKGTIIDSIPFRTAEDFLTKNKAELKLEKKHHLVPPTGEEKLRAMSQFCTKEYFQRFYEQNMALTKQGIREAVHEDQLIIQAIANLNELDKTVNLLSKRLREWYSLYLPELAESVADQQKYAELLTSKTRNELMKEIQQQETMGAELKPFHLNEISLLGKEVLSLCELRKAHEQYLQSIMKEYCPNLLELAGTTIGAKLLEHSKGLKRLALLPASTIQLLGAEKALFRHLKSGSRSPKYGLIFQHPLIQKAERQNKGKAARALADKLSLCARIDYFKGEFRANIFQKELEGRFL